MAGGIVPCALAGRQADMEVVGIGAGVLLGCGVGVGAGAVVAPLPSQPVTRESATKTTRRHIRFLFLLLSVSSEAFPFVWQNSLSVKGE